MNRRTNSSLDLHRLRRFCPLGHLAQLGDPRHDGSTHVFVEFLPHSPLGIGRKIERLPVNHGDRPQPNPLGARRQYIVGTLEVCRDNRASRLGDNDTESRTSRTQFTCKAARPLRIYHHCFALFDQTNCLSEPLAIQPAHSDRNPAEPLAKPAKTGNRKKILPPQIGSPTGQTATQHRNVQIAGMIRRNKDSAFPWHILHADRPVAKEEPGQRPEENPKQRINDTAHSFVAITASMRSSTSCSSSVEVSITCASSALTRGATSRVQSRSSRMRTSSLV